MNRTVFLSDLTSHSYGSRTPSAPLRRLRAFFLLAQPPLLFQEGNTLSWQFIHSFIDRRYSYWYSLSNALSQSFVSVCMNQPPMPGISAIRIGRRTFATRR